MAKTVRVDLKRPYWDADKRLYRPGRNVEMPIEDARKLKLVPAEAKGAKPSEPAKPEGPNATPEAIELANEYQIDIATVKGTGQDGRVTKPDVQDVVDALTDPNGGEGGGSGDGAGSSTAP